MRKRMLFLFLTCLLGSASAVQAAWMQGQLNSKYYHFQDIAGNDRFTFTQSVNGSVVPASWKGWSFDFDGELRDSNDPVKGVDDATLQSAVLKGSAGPVDLSFGRMPTLTGGFGMIDGLELKYDKMPVKIALSGGAEFYPVVRTHRADLPDRSRVGMTLNGIIPKGPNWRLDHVTRIQDGETDDQYTSLALRCRRLKKFGWDMKVGYDSEIANIRDFQYSIFYKPADRFTVKARYTLRRYRIYQDSFLSRFEIEPTQLAGLTTIYRPTKTDLYCALAFDHRFREEGGDLERVSVMVGNEHGELGLRYQSGTDLNHFGGWIEADGDIMPHLMWNASVEFDSWDSAWDAEPTDEWVNSVGLSYDMNAMFRISGAVEHYRNEELDADVRGLITFRLGFGL